MHFEKIILPYIAIATGIFRWLDFMVLVSCFMAFVFHFVLFRYLSFYVIEKGFCYRWRTILFLLRACQLKKNRVLWVKWGRYFSLFLLWPFHAENNQGVNYSAIHDGFSNSFFTFSSFYNKDYPSDQMTLTQYFTKLNFQSLIISSCNYIKSIAIKSVNFNIS